MRLPTGYQADRRQAEQIIQIASATFEIVGLPPLKLAGVESAKRADPKRITQH
jgi:hypothetical protein